ncbi:hypothetical protein TWF281_006441 [Arthrobotrys megalospora]
MGGTRIQPNIGMLPVNREAATTAQALPTPMEGIQIQSSVGMLPIPASSPIPSMGVTADWFMGPVPPGYQTAGEHISGGTEQQLLPPPPKKPKLGDDPGA